MELFKYLLVNSNPVIGLLMRQMLKVGHIVGGETYQAGSLKKTLVGGDTPTNVFHTQPGTYNFDATGTNFNLQYQAVHLH